MGRTSVRLIVLSFLIAMAGLVMLIMGLKSEGLDNPFEGFDKAGIGVLVSGGVLFVLGLFLLRRD